MQTQSDPRTRKSPLRKWGAICIGARKGRKGKIREGKGSASVLEREGKVRKGKGSAWVLEREGKVR